MNLGKLVELIKIVPQRPEEVLDRIQSVLEVRQDQNAETHVHYQPVPWTRLLEDLDAEFGGKASGFAQEPELREIESLVHEGQQSLTERAPWTWPTDGDVLLGRLCYVIARATNPQTVLETGVAYGVTSAFVLQALTVDGQGELHSVDLPPLGKNADSFVGALIPEGLRERWHLHRGTSKRVLPALLPQLGHVDFFIHDSLHTFRTMLWEFETVELFLSADAAVVADDVQGNRAFDYWTSIRPNRLSRTLQEESKDALLGLSIG